MVSLIDPVTLTNILLIAISGTLICIAVHFIPVGGAPAAMAQATGIGTGTVELAAGSGLVGLLTASHLYTNEPGASVALVLAAGAMGSMIMMASVGIACGIMYAYGIGVPFASAQVKRDPITGSRQDLYVSKGTQGHGVPTVCFVSGLIGAALGGIGGSLIYYVLYGLYHGALVAIIPDPETAKLSAAAVAGVFTMGVFYVNSVIPSYGVAGTIEGFHDPKFRRVLPKDAVSSFLVSLISGVVAVLIVGGMVA
jgi:tetrahydromethanopterin S-methyltransferase subunit D